MTYYQIFHDRVSFSSFFISFWWRFFSDSSLHCSNDFFSNITWMTFFFRRMYIRQVQMSVLLFLPILTAKLMQLWFSTVINIFYLHGLWASYLIARMWYSILHRFAFQQLFVWTYHMLCKSCKIFSCAFAFFASFIVYVNGISLHLCL